MVCPGTQKFDNKTFMCADTASCQPPCPNGLSALLLSAIDFGNSSLNLGNPAALLGITFTSTNTPGSGISDAGLSTPPTSTTINYFSPAGGGAEEGVVEGGSSGGGGSGGGNSGGRG